MPARPLIQDVHTDRIQFKPGDRLLARVSVSLTTAQYKKLENGVKKFAGEDVRLLIVDVTKVRLVWSRRGEIVQEIAGPSFFDPRPEMVGVADLRCSVIEFQPDDILHVFVPHISSELHRLKITDRMRQWTGKEVDVRVLEGVV